MASPMPDLSGFQLDLVSLGMAIEQLREHHTAEDLQVSALIEDVWWNYQRVNATYDGEDNG